MTFSKIPEKVNTGFGYGTVCACKIFIILTGDPPITWHDDGKFLIWFLDVAIEIKHDLFPWQTLKLPKVQHVSPFIWLNFTIIH